MSMNILINYLRVTTLPSDVYLKTSIKIKNSLFIHIGTKNVFINFLQ